MILVWLLACTTCPEGFEKGVAGRCEPTGSVTGTPGPMTSDRFQSKYEDDGCDALTDCVCDALDIDDCDDVDVDCDPFNWAWAAGCTFDPDQADACLSQRWDCDVDGDNVFALAPDACETVYDCGPTTTDTGA